MSTTKKHGFGTLAVHAGAPWDAATGAVIESVSISTSQAYTLALLVTCKLSLERHSLIYISLVWTGEYILHIQQSRTTQETH